jgi:hypothetical protein
MNRYNSWVHHVHTTDGFTIGSKPYGEAGKIVFIYTRDLGFLTAIAQGIRLEKSKLRYSIRDYGFASFSLVHGKEFWRIVGASEMLNRYSKEKRETKVGNFGSGSLSSCVVYCMDKSLVLRFFIVLPIVPILLNRNPC